MGIYKDLATWVIIIRGKIENLYKIPSEISNLYLHIMEYSI